MDESTHYKKLERMYLSAPCNEIYNPSITVAERQAEISIQITASLHHAAGAVHGSTYFKLLDDAAFFAANSLVDDVFVVTANFNIHLLRPVIEGHLTAEGNVKTRAGSQLIAESVLLDADNKIIATGSGAFIKSKTKLSADIGYE